MSDQPDVLPIPPGNIAEALAWMIIVEPRLNLDPAQYPDDPPPVGNAWQMLFWMHQQGKVDLEKAGMQLAGPVPVKQQAHRMLRDNPTGISEN